MKHQLQTFFDRYGMRVDAAQLVANLDCRVYRVRSCAGPGPVRDWALRVYPAGRQDATAILDELAWLNGASDQGLHVPRPQADLQGRLLQAWQSQSGGAPQHAVLLSWLHGRVHARDLTPARLHRVGVLAGHLHRVSRQLATADVFKARRIAWTADLRPWISGTRARSDQLAPNFQAVLKVAAARLQAQMKTFTPDASTWGWVHSDLHLWNVIFIRDVAGAIDFSDCGWGHHALDLAAYLQYIRHPLAGNFDHRAQYDRLRDSLLDGYASVYPHPPAMLDQLPVYLTARLFVTLDWVLDDWPSLHHRAWGPGFLVGAQAALDDYLRS